MQYQVMQVNEINRFPCLGGVSVQWPVPLDTLDTQHVSSFGHVSHIQRI